MPDSTPPVTPAASETPAAPAGPSNLRLRIIYGVLGAALLLGSVWFSPWTFGLFFAFVQAVMLWEFYRMMRAGGYAPTTWIGVGAGTLIFLNQAFSQYIEFQSANYYIVGNGYTMYPPLATVGEASGNSATLANMLVQVWISRWELLSLVVLIALMVHSMIRWPQEVKPFENIGLTILGVIYVSTSMSMLASIAYEGKHYDPRRVFALLFLIWASDIGAYAVGRAIGKHKLAPQISPGKTWEGWAGGFLMTLIVGWAVGFMLPDMPLSHRLVAAGVVAVFAPLGDLAESMLKRSVGVKDSGSIMPGHGGLLDRFDAFLLVLPVLALLQLLVG
ncbi:phosphatidate cytidylyltransferase [Hymenobacter rubidus]|uniref:phosphatidate cytidylyltransferase n=1 Tax=Hymenobacter rubidus TaxID=1441626 RepID=UPI0019202D8F|nr:phosphatidate cytidylyltransferase [Hymenobacter rubidus]